jgi:hypothetical protein
MGQGDRVLIVNGSGIMSDTDKDAMVIVFQPRRDGSGEMIWDPTGQIASVQKAGGVKTKSTGIIVGPPIRVRKEEIPLGEAYTPGFGGHDYVEMYPVMLDQYQQVGWFQTSNMRITMGDPNLDRA